MLNSKEKKKFNKDFKLRDIQSKENKKRHLIIYIPSLNHYDDKDKNTSKLE